MRKNQIIRVGVYCLLLSLNMSPLTSEKKEVICNLTRESSKKRMEKDKAERALKREAYKAEKLREREAAEELRAEPSQEVTGRQTLSIDLF